jgi:hypothetical protein
MIDRTREWTLLTLSTASLAFFHFVTLPDEPAIQLCAFRWITGRPCPLCGMTRALGYLAKGNWQRAVEFHALSPIVFALLIAAALICAVRLIAGKPRELAVPWAAWKAAAAVFGVYGVTRWM